MRKRPCMAASARFACACVVILVCANVCRAGVSASEIATNVHLDQRAGERIPLQLTFTDDEGRPARLSQYVSQRPAILAFVYYTCPNLCPTLLLHLTEEMNGIGLVAGRDFDVIVVSIDPTDTVQLAAERKLTCVRVYRYHEASEGWHFLIGAAPQLEQLERAVGLHSLYDAQHKQYAHPLGAIVVGPGGILSHYFYGIDISPADLEAALKDAAAGRSSRVDRPQQQYCLNYRPADSYYGRIVVHWLQVLAALWVALLVGYIAWELTREHRRGVRKSLDHGNAHRLPPDGGEPSS